MKFLKREETETGIMVRRGEGDLAFWHASFQEYLAAEEIAGKTDDISIGWWPVLQKNIEKPEWREVICLVPACLIRLGSDRVDLLLKRLSKQYANADWPLKAKGVGLGGCILKDLRVYGYEPKNVASWAKISNEIRPIFEEGGQEISPEDRYNAAVAYGIGGDNRLRNFEETWISLQGGIYYMGAQAYDRDGLNFDPEATEWEGPVTKVNVSPFEIRKYLITVEEFNQFYLDDGYENSAREYWTLEGWEWRSKNNISSPMKWDEQLLFPNCPVSGISWFESKAYCKWLTEKELRNIEYRLPSEVEWEYAARHGQKPGQRFPLRNGLTKGDLAEANWLGCNLNKKTPIGMFTKSNTVDGIADMIGNVEEWCEDCWSWSHNNYLDNSAPQIIPKENGYLFSWDEIPGNDSVRLIAFLKQSFGIDLIKNAKIEKSDDEMTIRVSTEKTNISLNLIDGKTKVNQNSDVGRIDKFIAKMENGKLNIYETARIVRGGSTIRVSRLCRPTYRSKCDREKGYETIGFRPVRCRIIGDE
ncbi:SUMF1/EgtB/PvdO family nonheme iron enzyme [Candidatus Pacearchaeota archaeon]|nr:SUMF1/EgtB/PvdO family nonheme iron enzyme [Candidatus Pacearchaeota archaeon]